MGGVRVVGGNGWGGVRVVGGRVEIRHPWH